MANKTCCPTGKIFDPSTGLCYTLNHLEPENPIDCPCCPIGYVYNSLTGECETTTAPITTTATIDCPCCPEGLTWYSFTSILYPNGVCAPPGTTVFSNAEVYNVPIPCLPCNCVEPEPRECEDCTAYTGLPINFVFNPTIKQCTDCEQPNEPRMTNDCYFNNFMTYFMIDPIINFKLR